MIVIVDDLSHQYAKNVDIAWVKWEYQQVAQLMLIARLTMAAAGATDLANVRSDGVNLKMWACPACCPSRRIELLTGLDIFVVLWDMLWTLR